MSRSEGGKKERDISFSLLSSSNYVHALFLWRNSNLELLHFPGTTVRRIGNPRGREGASYKAVMQGMTGPQPGLSTTRDTGCPIFLQKKTAPARLKAKKGAALNISSSLTCQDPISRFCVSLATVEGIPNT